LRHKPQLYLTTTPLGNNFSPTLMQEANLTNATILNEMSLKTKKMKEISTIFKNHPNHPNYPNYR